MLQVRTTTARCSSTLRRGTSQARAPPRSKTCWILFWDCPRRPDPPARAPAPPAQVTAAPRSRLRHRHRHDRTSVAAVGTCARTWQVGGPCKFHHHPHSMTLQRWSGHMQLYTWSYLCIKIYCYTRPVAWAACQVKSLWRRRSERRVVEWAVM